MRRLLVATLLLAPFGLPGRAAADCERPTLFVEPPAGEPGSAITIRGENFGTNCYDTGPPPPGQGVLGEPQTNVVISFTAPGFERTVLGTVDAGPNYRCTLETAVPADAGAGTASIQAGGSGAFALEFEVLGEPAVIPAEPAFTG